MPDGVIEALAERLIGPEHLPRDHAGAAPARLGEDQQQRLRVALELQRLPARHERHHLDAIGEPQRLRELAIRGAEPADEPNDDVLQPRLGKRAQERLRVALPEERARVRDPEALAPPPPPEQLRVALPKTPRVLIRKRSPGV